MKISGGEREPTVDLAGPWSARILSPGRSLFLATIRGNVLARTDEQEVPLPDDLHLGVELPADDVERRLLRDGLLVRLEGELHGLGLSLPEKALVLPVGSPLGPARQDLLELVHGDLFQLHYCNPPSWVWLFSKSRLLLIRDYHIFISLSRGVWKARIQASMHHPMI